MCTKCERHKQAKLLSQSKIIAEENKYILKKTELCSIFLKIRNSFRQLNCLCKLIVASPHPTMQEVLLNLQLLVGSAIQHRFVDEDGSSNMV